MKLIISVSLWVQDGAEIYLHYRMSLWHGASFGTGLTLTSTVLNNLRKFLTVTYLTNVSVPWRTACWNQS